MKKALALCFVAAMCVAHASAAIIDVAIQNTMYNPSAVTISAGDTVRWTNFDFLHTVSSDTNLFDSGFLGSNQQFSHTFNTAGTFGYHCNVHRTMFGTVNVNPVPEPSALLALAGGAVVLVRRRRR
jgi:plastocyanin